MSLAKLEAAILELDGLLSQLYGLLEEAGWPRKTSRTKLPSVTTNLLEQDPFQVSVAERAPVPDAAAVTYQQWFSATRAILERNQRSRLKEFDALHVNVTEALTRNYMTQGDQLTTMSNLRQQSNILQAVPSYLRYSAFDIELEAYATLMDDEVAAAAALVKQGFLRPAGALLGVILERYLKNLLRKREPPVSFRQNATLSTLNDLCKDVVYDQITWRRVQHLSDLRNLCAHEKEREPTKSEVGELLTGVSGIIRSNPT